MREWVTLLEEAIDNKLRKWRKSNTVENPGAVNFQWQFEQTLMVLAIVWINNHETVTFHCIGPSACHRYIYYGLNRKTFNRVCDRVGNLAQLVMHPPVDPDSMDDLDKV